MNKNPFVPQPTFNPPQPPLPPGPPPAGPPPDYSAYWAAATAQHQSQQSSTAAAPVAYNPQWSTPQPQRPPPEQSALYANYGYGGQNMHWQLRQPQQQPQHYQPVQPMAPPPPPPQPQPQPQYNPYQASVGFQAYVPQPPQPIISQPTYPQAHQTIAPPQPYFPQQQTPQPQQTRHHHAIHHTPPQHLPPAKRQKYDGPGVNHHHGQPRQQGPPPQPQFQPPPTPQNHIYGPNPSHQGANQVPLGGSTRGGMGSRGGSMNAGRGRGGSMGGTRGGMGGQRGGRGGGSFMSGGGGRGSQQGSLRGHGSRGGFGNKQDFHSRRGGSFNQQHHQGNVGTTGFRGRGQGHSSGRAARQDGPNAQLGNRDTLSGSFASSGKKDENRRTLTDFKIVGLEMPELGWTWGVLPSAVKLEGKEGVASLIDSSRAFVKEESIQPNDLSGGERADATHRSEHAVSDASAAVNVKVEPPVGDQSMLSSPPPSRIRIYFHTPVSPDDSHPIPHNSSYTYGTSPMDSRKGKRKKLEDDDGDTEEGRERPPPPRGSQMSDTASVDLDGMGRGSAAPSVAETASEGDWLMAAIAEDDGDTPDVEVSGLGEPADDEDDNQLRVSRVEDPHVEVSEPAIPGLGGDVINGEFPTGLNCRYDGCFRTWMERVHLTIGGFTGLTLAPKGTIVDGHGIGSSGDGCTAVVIRDTGDHINSAAENDATPAPSSATAKNCASGQSERQLDVDFVSTVEEAAEPAPSEASKPSHSAEDGSDAVLSGCSPLIEPSRLASQSSSSLSSSFDVSSSRASAAPSATFVQSGVSQLDNQLVDHAGHAQDPKAKGNAADVAKAAVTTPKSLQRHSSFASTVIDDSPDNELFSQEEEIMTQVDKSALDQSQPDENLAHDIDREHLPEPPASPTSNTLLSTSSGSTYGESLHPPAITVPKKGKTPSANRLSISYAAGSRRLVVNAEVVEYLRVYRAEGRIEVYMSLENDDESLKGVLVEGLSESTKSYLPLPAILEPRNADETIPSFSKVSLPSKVHLIVYLDTDRPLSEPKWVKSGDVQEWLKSMFGRMFWVAGEAAGGWEKKIEVVDPDPAPTIWTVLDGWAVNSPVGVQTERQRFLKTHMTEVDNLLEILLRLVRGERATPFSQTAPAISAPSISGPLLAAFSQSSSHGAQQTHVSLAVLAMFYITLEYAQKASGDKGKAEVEERIGEIIRCLPSHLIYKSLDGIFKEWRAEKKGAR